jgi:rhodanese-related sulfurtransferase
MIQKITRDDLQGMNDGGKDDFVLVNVLPREEFNQRHIRTSINVPVGSADFPQRVEAVAGGKQREIVVYCASFDCDASEKAARELDEAGFSRVFDYEGGTKDWLEGAR